MPARPREPTGSAGAQIGKISVNEFSTYVSVERDIAAQVLRRLNAGKVKGKKVKARRMENGPEADAA